MSEPPAESEPSQAAAPRAIRAVWVAADRTLERLGRTLQPLAIGLMDELVEVTAVCPADSDTRELPSPPVRVLRYGPPRRWWMSTGGAERAAEQVSQQKPDLVHALDGASAELARRLARTADVPLVITSLSLEDGKLLAHHRPRPAAVLAGSAAVREELLSRHVAPVHRVHLLEPGVHQVKRATCFVEPRHSAAVVASGAMDDAAAWRAVLKCFRDVRDAGHDCSYFAIGNGRAERAIRAEAVKLGLLHEMTFVDRQTGRQLVGIFKAADIYISPAPTRRVDISSLLAMAAGVPVLSAGGGASDFLIDGQTARLFTPADAPGLSRLLADMLNHRDAARQLAADALEHLRRHHTPAQAVAELAGIYRDIAGPD